MKDFSFYAPDMPVEILFTCSDEHPPIEVVLPSTIYITPEQARRFADALLRAADAWEAP